jgi:ubiquinone biosynthesis protein
MVRSFRASKPRVAARCAWLTLIVLSFAGWACAALLWTSLAFRGELRRRRSRAVVGRALRRALSTLGPLFVKLGQVLSSRPDLVPAEIIAELEHLQDRVPSMPWRKVVRSLAGLPGGGIEAHFSFVDERALAAGSVAQVHDARLMDGTPIVIKALRPGVRARMHLDARIVLGAARLASFSAQAREVDLAGHARYLVRAALSQLDLRAEARNYGEFRRNFRAMPNVRFPRVYREHSTADLVCLEKVEGSRLQRGRSIALGAILQQVVLQMCFSDGFVHADLHPGNLMVDALGRLVILDAGLVKRLNHRRVEEFLDLARCIILAPPGDFVAHMLRYNAAASQVDQAALARDAEARFAPLRKRKLAELEFREIADALFSIQRAHSLHPVPDMVMVLVGLVTAEGISRQLDPTTPVLEAAASYLLMVQQRRAQQTVGAA